MSSMLQAKSGVNTNALAREIAGNHKMHHVIAPKDGVRDESNALSGIKGQVIAEAAAHGTRGLHHVDAPGGGISSAVKEAYLAEHGQQHGQQGGAMLGSKQCNKAECANGNCRCENGNCRC